MHRQQRVFTLYISVSLVHIGDAKKDIMGPTGSPN